MRPLFLAVCLWFLLAIRPTHAASETNQIVYLARTAQSQEWLEMPGAHCIRFDWNHSMLSPAFDVKGWPSWTDGQQRWERIGYTLGLNPQGAPWPLAMSSFIPAPSSLVYPVGLNGATIYWREEADGFWLHIEPRENPICSLGMRLVLPIMQQGSR